MAAELVDTSRLYARCIAQIQPEWLEKIAAHLLKKNISEPRWEKRANQVSAFERATLYGLVVYSQRRIQYGLTHPEEAREIFIRDALVAGEFDTRAPFFAHNQKLVREIENLEHKSRRVDVLVDDSLIIAFYDKLIPAEIFNGITFEKWHKEATQNNPKLLYLQRNDLMRHEAAGVTTEVFPKNTVHSGVELQLSYHFEPGTPRDGVTLTVPLFALNQVSLERCEWLVPGMLKEKVQLLLKSLPQKIRRPCVPIPDYAAGFCERITFGEGSFLAALITDIREQTGLHVKPDDFKFETIPTHLIMNFKIIDDHGRQLEMGRNLAALRLELGSSARASFQKRVQGSDTPPDWLDSASPKAVSKLKPASPVIAVQNEPITSWTLGELPELLEITMEKSPGKPTLIGYPALVDKETSCELQVFDDPAVAAKIHRQGLLRLFALQLKDQLKFLEKNIPGLQQMGMHFMSLGSQEELRRQIIELAFERTFLQSPLPVNAEQFLQRKEDGRARLNLLTNEIARLAGVILAEFYSLPKKLQGIKSAGTEDMQTQLKTLITKRFIVDTPYAQLVHYPRYLKAISVRLEKMRADSVRDSRLMQEWTTAAAGWQRTTMQAKNSDVKLQEYRWLLEELRVSLFAQELKTPMPVSVKRLQKIWESGQRQI